MTDRHTSAIEFPATMPANNLAFLGLEVESRARPARVSLNELYT